MKRGISPKESELVEDLLLKMLRIQPGRCVCGVYDK